MVHLLRSERYFGHKCKCFTEICEFKCAIKMLICFLPHMIEFLDHNVFKTRLQKIRLILFLMSFISSRVTSCTVSTFLHCSVSNLTSGAW